MYQQGKGVENESSHSSEKMYTKYLPHWVWMAWGLCGLIAFWVIAIAASLAFNQSRGIDLTESATPINISVNIRPVLIREIDSSGTEKTSPYFVNITDQDREAWRAGMEPAIKQIVLTAAQAELQSFDDRINEVWAAIQGIGLISAVIGVLITVLVIYFSFHNSASISSAKTEIKDYALSELPAYLSSVLPAHLSSVLPAHLTEYFNTIAVNDNPQNETNLQKSITEVLNKKGPNGMRYLDDQITNRKNDNSKAET